METAVRWIKSYFEFAIWQKFEAIRLFDAWFLMKSTYAKFPMKSVITFLNLYCISLIFIYVSSQTTKKTTSCRTSYFHSIFPISIILFRCWRNAINQSCKILASGHVSFVFVVLTTDLRNETNRLISDEYDVYILRSLHTNRTSSFGIYVHTPKICFHTRFNEVSGKWSAS